MGRPKTLLERLSEHVQSFDCGALTVEPKDGQQCVFARFGGEPERIAAFKNSTADGQELRQNLYAAARKPVRAVIEGRLFTITARILDRVAGSFGEDAFEVSIDPRHRPIPRGRRRSRPNKANIWRLFITTRRSTGKLRPNPIWSVISRCPRRRFTT